MSSSPKKRARRERARAETAGHGQQPRPLTVALVGSPNTGKSTLFNRLCGARDALVSPTAGTTRDVKEGSAWLAGLGFQLLDTGGLELLAYAATSSAGEAVPTPAGTPSHLAASMAKLTQRAVQFADTVLFMVDAREGMSQEDAAAVQWLRKVRGSQDGIHVIANKAEFVFGAAGQADERWLQMCADVAGLGLDLPIALSAEHGDGLADLHSILLDASQAAADDESRWDARRSAWAADMAATAASDSAPEPGAAQASDQALSRAPLLDSADGVRRLAELYNAEFAGASHETPGHETATLLDDDLQQPHEVYDMPGMVDVDGWASPEPSAVGTTVVLDDGELGYVADDGTLVHASGRIVLGASQPSARGAKTAAIRAVKDAGPCRVAVVGRPNVGKSSLVNTLLGQARVLTGDAAGITRDPTEVAWEAAGRTWTLIDTAGMRRWGLWDLSTPLEGAAHARAKKALALAHVAVLVVDATVGLTKQDVRLAADVLEEGRALVVALNKCDLATNKAALGRLVCAQLEKRVSDARGVQVVHLSATQGTGMGGLLPALSRAADRWSVRIPTGYLNRWLRRVSAHHPPPAAFKKVKVPVAGRRKAVTKSVPLKIKYLSQVNARPPSFALFANRADVPESYLRFLAQALRAEFTLWGVPVRVFARSSKNPHAS